MAAVFMSIFGFVWLYQRRKLLYIVYSVTLYLPIILKGSEKSEWPQLYLPAFSENAIAGLLCKPVNTFLLNAKEPQALQNEVKYLMLYEKHADQDKFCREKSKEL